MPEHDPSRTSHRLTVMHATALTPDDAVPGMHAMALVAAAGGRLWTVHTTDAKDPPAEIPDAMDVLRGWARARKVGTEELGSVECHRLVQQGADDPDGLLLKAVAELQPDLIVAGTRARRGIDLALMGSTAQALVREAKTPVLLLPAGYPGFVDPDTGELRLHQVLVPAGDHASAQAALDAAVPLAELMGPRTGEFVLVHVGSDDDAPAVQMSGALGWGRRWVPAEGGVVDAVLGLAETERADLVVMASRGRDSLLDSLLGSRTERVLRRSPCALLAVPLVG